MPARSAPTRPNRKTAWRRGPATPRQLHVLRKIATESGHTFDPNITAGEASELIQARLRANPKARRAHERAERKRRRLHQRLVNPAANWRFGDKQTPEQEQAEIRRARRDGLEDVYMQLQTWTHARRREAERVAAAGTSRHRADA